MAVQLELTRKVDGSRVPLVPLDDEICSVLGVEPNPVEFLAGWMDTIGFTLALGGTFDEARVRWFGGRDDEKSILRGRIIDYLETYFDNTSYGTR
jgi:hypothetical protein